MSGTLYVVATPIGNLEDITLRALRVLREVALIAAEDTRRTAKLLTHYGISTPTISFHRHNARTRIPQFLGRLDRGDSIAVVSDAGTPGISDPGLELVHACIDNGIPIDAIPGASALLTALVASGFSTFHVTFLGFPPNKAKDRKGWWETVSKNRATFVFFEAPHRITACLTEAAEYLGERPMFVGRELTKLHQEFLRGSAEDIGKRLKDVRGEFTVVVGPAWETAEESQVNLPEDAVLLQQFRRLTDDDGLTRRQAIAELALKYKRPQREIFGRLEEAKTTVS